MNFPYGISVDVVRETTDRFGDPVTETVKTIHGCVYSPTAGKATVRASTEDLEMKNQLVQKAVLYLPAGSDVEYTDILIINGERWFADGAAQLFVSPFTGWNPGMPLPIKRVVG